MKDLISIDLKSTKVSDAGGIQAKGFTLVELMVAMVVASIIMAAIYSVHVGLMRSYTTQNVAADVQQTMRAGIDFLVEDIMMAGLYEEDFRLAYDDNLGIIEAGSKKIRLRADKNMDGNFAGDFEDITYEYDDDPDVKELQVTDNNADPPETQTFINNVTSLTFTYFDENDNVTAELGAIRTVAISMTVQEPAGGDRTVERTSTTRVMLRNFGL
jgi:type IV pilus assembly protein PilW